jgi:predicted nucleotidyltransferase
MKINNTLNQLGQKRDALLAKVTNGLKADERVVAAWLTGSFGRGEADEWSDLDLHVVIKNEDLDDIRQNSHQMFELGGEPLLVQGGGIPSDCMRGGYFWLVMYSGALEVDWNIGSLSEAERQEASVVLFDKIGIPLAPPLTSISEEERIHKAQQSLLFFWAMTPIALKYAGRGHTRLTVGQIALLRAGYATLWYAVWKPERLQAEQHHQNRLTDADLLAQLPQPATEITPLRAIENILALCTEVEKLHPKLAEMGVAVSSKLVADVKELAELAKIWAEQGGTRPNYGSRR